MTEPCSIIFSTTFILYKHQNQSAYEFDNFSPAAGRVKDKTKRKNVLLDSRFRRNDTYSQERESEGTSCENAEAKFAEMTFIKKNFSPAAGCVMNKKKKPEKFFKSLNKVTGRFISGPPFSRG